jgi:hypothetical protein
MISLIIRMFLPVNAYIRGPFRGMMRSNPR